MDQNPNPSGDDQVISPPKESLFKQFQSSTSSVIKQVSTSVKNTIDIVQQKIEEALKEPPILIQVCDPMTKDSGFKKHTVFSLKGQDRIGSFDLYRRYKDFHALREHLTIKWPGCFIPPIPDKLTGQGNDIQVVQERKRQLDYFCKAISKIQFIYYSDDFCQIFLRSGGLDIEKIFNNLPKPETQEILDRFKETFPKLDTQENGGNVLIISTTLGSLKKNVQNLKSYVEQGSCLSQSRRLLNDNKTILFATILPEYEKKCQLEIHGGNENKLIIANPSNVSVMENIDKLRDFNRQNPLDMIYDLMKIDFRECEAMLFSINQREQYMQQKVKIEAKVREDQSALVKLSQGKQSLTTIATLTTNKDEAQLKIEQRITNNQKEADLITLLVDFITTILAQIEIPKYKQWRVSHYRQTLKDIQSQEAQVSISEKVLWDQINSLSIDLSKI